MEALERTKKNVYAHQKERGLKRKMELIMARGSKCEKCGYDKNISALEFHHIDPSKKEFPLDIRHLSNTSMEKIIEESKKCILVCANCHREIHYEELDKERINETLDKFRNEIGDLLEDYKLSLYKMGRCGGSFCPVCGKNFKRVTGKIFCSKECMIKSKNYPSYEEIHKKYEELGSWEKVASFFGITRKVVRGIRKRYESDLK